MMSRADALAAADADATKMIRRSCLRLSRQDRGRQMAGLHVRIITDADAMPLPRRRHLCRSAIDDVACPAFVA